MGPLPEAPRSPVREQWIVLGLLVIGVLLPISVSAIAGSLEIPRNDDWTYRRIALELAGNGRLALEGASRPMLVGQILVTQPFLWLSGLQPWGFVAVGLAFAIGGALGAYLMARQLLRPGVAIIPALLLVVFPGYLAYATSYMTDVPAMAATFFCLALGAMALRRRPVSMGLLVASVAVGFLAFSIRQFAVAAPVGVVVAAICAQPNRRATWMAGVAFAGACLGLYLWETTLPGQFGDALDYSNGASRILLALTSTMLVLAPAAIVAASRWRPHWRASDVAIGAEIGLLVAGLRAVQWLTGVPTPTVLLENLMSPWGAPGPNVLAGGRPLLFADAVWLLVTLLALAALVVTLAVAAGVAGVHLRRWRASRSRSLDRFGSPQGLLFVFAVITVLGLVAFGLGNPMFDRYLWPLVPVLAALLLYVPADLAAHVPIGPSAVPGRWFGLAATVVGVTLAAVSMAYLLNAHAFDVARWRAGEALVRLGIPASEIDAGYEWVGYHATTPALIPDASRGPTSYLDMWPSFRKCGLVSSDPRPPAGAETVGSNEYRLLLGSGPIETLYLYRMVGDDCPAGSG